MDPHCVVTQARCFGWVRRTMSAWDGRHCWPATARPPSLRIRPRSVRYLCLTSSLALIRASVFFFLIVRVHAALSHEKHAALHMLALAQLELGRVADASESLSAALEYSNAFVPVWCFVLFVLYACSPVRCQARLAQARLHMVRGNFEAAEEDFTILLPLNATVNYEVLRSICVFVFLSPGS